MAWLNDNRVCLKGRARVVLRMAAIVGLMYKGPAMTNEHNANRWVAMRETETAIAFVFLLIRTFS